MVFNPPIGYTSWVHMDKMRKRCLTINRLLSTLRLPINFKFPRTFGARPVKRFVFEVDKCYLNKRQINLLVRIFNRKAMRDVGLNGYKVQRVKVVYVTDRKFELLAGI
jgi:hypothetical protein